MLFKVILGLSVILLPQVSYSGFVQSDWVTIDQVSMGYNVKRVNLVFYPSTNPIPNPNNCTPSNEAAIDEEQVNQDHLYTLALAAFTSKKEVKLVICDDRCSNSGRVKVMSIHAK